MKKLHLAASAMLGAFGLALPTIASAAPVFPRALVSGVSHHEPTLVQYGGDDDDQGGGYSAPRGGNSGGGGGGYSSPGGGYSHPRGGDGGAGAAIEIMRGIGGMIQQQQRQQQQQRYYQQQRRDRIDETNRRNRDDRLRRAKQEELDKIKRQQQQNAERDRLKKLEQARQQLDQLNAQKAADDQRRKQQDAILQQEKEEKGRDEAYGYNEPYGPGEKVEDKLENNNVTINVTVVPHDDRPQITEIENLYVNSTVQLPACGYVNLPADRSLCSGRTVSGGWLRVASVPTPGGGQRSACVSYCTSRPYIPPRVVVLPPRPTPPTPQPTVVIPPPYQPRPVVIPEPKPVTPAILTVMAETYVEPAHKPTTPAVLTVMAHDYVEPAHKPTTPAVLTVMAHDYVEPSTTTPAVLTVMAHDYVEPSTTTPAVLTVTAHDYVEPSTTTPAVLTVTAHDYVEPSTTTFAVLTATAHSYTQPDPRGPVTKTDEPDFGFDSFEPANNNRKPDAVDGRGCTAAGVKPLTAALSEPLATFRSPAFSSREVSTTVISGIPKIGGLISGVTKMFWKDDSKDQLFDEMVKYVHNVVEAAIGNYDKKQLDDDLTKIHNRMSEYDDTRTLSTKGQVLTRLVELLGDMQPRFLNPQSPKSTLAEFVAFGTLRLAALRELYDHYDQYYPFDPKDPKAVRDHQDDRRRVQSNLNNGIKEYKDHVQKVREDIIADRLSKLRVNDRGEMRTEFFSVEAPDVQIHEDYFSAKDDFCDWQGPEHMDVVRPANAEIPAQADVERRKKVVRMAYNKLIDELVAPLQRFRPVCNDDTIDPNKVSAAELEDWATRARAHRSDMDCLR